MMKLLLTIVLLSSLACSIDARKHQRIRDLRRQLEAEEKDGNLRGMAAQKRKERRRLQFDEGDFTEFQIKSYDSGDYLAAPGDTGGTVRTVSDGDSGNSTWRLNLELGMLQAVNTQTRQPSGGCLEEFDDRRRGLAGLFDRRRLKTRYLETRVAACDSDNDAQRWNIMVVPKSSTHIYAFSNVDTGGVIYFDEDDSRDGGAAVVRTWPIDRTELTEHSDTWITEEDPVRNFDLIDCSEDSLDSSDEDECEFRRRR